MNKFFLMLTVAVIGNSLFLGPASAQVPAPAPTRHVQITKEPELESAREDWAIIRWTSGNPRGSDEHFAVVRYGTDPQNLSETAKSHIRLNRAHSYTVFRVRVDGLKSKTTYYYKVDSVDARGRSDGLDVAMKTFMTP